MMSSLAAINCLADLRHIAESISLARRALGFAGFPVHMDKGFMSILRSHEDERTAATPHSIRNETLTVAMTLICPIESVPSLSAEAPPAF